MTETKDDTPHLRGLRLVTPKPAENKSGRLWRWVKNATGEKLFMVSAAHVAHVLAVERLLYIFNRWVCDEPDQEIRNVKTTWRGTWQTVAAAGPDYAVCAHSLVTEAVNDICGLLVSHGYDDDGAVDMIRRAFPEVPCHCETCAAKDWYVRVQTGSLSVRSRNIVEIAVEEYGVVIPFRWRQNDWHRVQGCGPMAAREIMALERKDQCPTCGLVK